MNENVIKINENGESVFGGDKYRIDIVDHEPRVQMYKNNIEWSALYVNDFKCSAPPENTFDKFKRIVEHWMGNHTIITHDGWFERMYQRWINLTVINIDNNGKFEFKGAKWQIDITKKYINLNRNGSSYTFISDYTLMEDHIIIKNYENFKEVLNYFICDEWFDRQVLEIHASEEWYRKMYKKWTNRHH